MFASIVVKLVAGNFGFPLPYLAKVKYLLGRFHSQEDSVWVLQKYIYVH